MAYQRKKTKQEIKKEQLIEAVKLLTKDCDLSELTVRDICAKLNFSTGSFYHYFKDKGEILACILSTVDEHLLTVEQERFTDQQYDNIMLTVQEYAQYNVDSGVNLIVHINGRKIAGNGQLYLHHQRPIFQILQRCYEAGLKNGEFKTPMSSQELAEMTLVVMRGYAFDWAKYNGEYDLVAKMSQCISFMIKGL
ncbi:MAG: TetR/AcrR family transcriptional regulator [Angelakisella sp.]